MSSIITLRREAATCNACPMYRHANQTVFGEGDGHAAIVLVGEQPGNDEDLAGRPFVGPAGRLLDRALERAGLERSSLYVTNAVKHFKWSKDRGGGKRRIHEKPSASEVEACRPWLEQELWLIRPQVVVCLGATAARSVLARAVTITASRGRPLTSPEGHAIATTVPVRMPPIAVGSTTPSTMRQRLTPRAIAPSSPSIPPRCCASPIPATGRTPRSASSRIFVRPAAPRSTPFVRTTKKRPGSSS